MNLPALIVDPMKGSARRRVAAGDMVTVVGKLFPGLEARRFADDLVPLDHQPAAVGVLDHPFSPEERHRVIGAVADRDEIHERVGLVRRQRRAAEMVGELVEAGGEPG